MMSVVRGNHNMPGRTVSPGGTREDYDVEDIGDNEDVVAGSIDTAEESPRSNPAQLFTWKNLRLQTAISGGKAARDSYQEQKLSHHHSQHHSVSQEDS